MNLPIGVFDSGIGGLTVVDELIKILPNEGIVYFGDTARVPYGNKSQETIKKFASQIVNFLIKKNVKLIVVACNTVSSNALDWLNEKYKIPIIGVIKPGVKKAYKSTKNKNIGIIGTKATIESRAYVYEIKKIDPTIKVYSKSCPLLVPLIEERSDSELRKLAIENYLKELKQKNVDTLILGCTHYPIIKKEIQDVMGNNVNIIDSASTVANEVKNILKKEGLENSENNRPEHQFFFSDIPRKFRQLTKKFIHYPISYTKISIE